MKLASYKDGSRDGQLLVVSADLGTAHYATGIATRLQQVLDDWNFLSPQLQELAQTLDHGKARHAFAFDPRRCMAPLPRAYLFAQPEPGAPGEPRALRSDGLHGPGASVAHRVGHIGLAVRPGIAAITGDIAAGTQANEALEGVRLLVLTAGLDASAQGDSPLSALSWAFAPVAITPDELGSAWQGGRAALGLRLHRHGARVANETADTLGTSAPLGEVLAALAAVQGLRSGSIVGAGALAAPVDWPRWQAAGSCRVEALNSAGQSPFGAISPDPGGSTDDAPSAAAPLDQPDD